MGREEVNRQVVIADARVAVQRAREMVLGPVRPHSTYEKACPKCGHDCAPDGGPPWLEQFCPGRIMLLPEQVEQPCQEPGEHLHRQCATCKYEFRVLCADASGPSGVV